MLVSPACPDGTPSRPFIEPRRPRSSRTLHRVSDEAGRTAPSGSVLEVLRAALRLGLTSFGGPIAHLGYFRREYVERRRWLDETTYADFVALSQLLPGPASSQLGILIGTRRAGMAGGIAAWLGFTLPSAIALVLFGLLARQADLSSAGWVEGLKIAAVAIVAQAVYLMARVLTPDWPRRLVAVLAAVVALAWTTPFAQVAIIAGGAVVGRTLLSVLVAAPTGPEPSPVSRRVGMLCLAAFGVLLVCLPLLVPVAGQPLALFEAFYRSGALVFGGGHVVLPLLNTTVVDPGWVSNDQFLAGYGAAQAVPGPLFSFAAYLGAVAGPNPNGAAGATIALVAIFLPSFLLIFGALPFWDQLRGSMGFRRALTGTNAAVVGILLAALYTPVWTSAITAPIDVGIAALGLAMLLTGRVPPLVVVAFCAAAGQLVAG
jgi:chromate transporter